MTASLRGKTAVTGIGAYGMGLAPDHTPLELMGKAAISAVEDAGLKMSDIDGVCAATFYHFFPSLSAAEYLGIHPTWSNSDMVGGSSFMNYILQAAAAIETGQCNHVLILYGSNARSSRDLNGLIETPFYENLYEPMVPLSGYALAASRYLHEGLAKREHFAHVHYSARQWAMKNPDAILRDPITIDEILAARPIATPLTKYDCCLLSDGGAALVLSRADLAKDTRQDPIYFLGGGSAHYHREIAQMPSLTTTAAVESSARAYEMARVTPKDIDVVQLYDAFTLNTLLFLEDLRFCKKGEAGEFVQSGEIAPGGSLPVNTNGGGLCCIHPGMYGLFCIIEAVIQLRGEAGERQVQSPSLAIAHGNGGTLSHQSTTIFGVADTL